MQELFEITGVEDIRTKLQKFGDSQKRSEYIKVMSRNALFYKIAYANALPKSSKDHFRYVGTKKRRRRGKGKVTNGDKILIKSGNLARSVSILSVPRKITKNPSIMILPSKNKKNDGFYRHMVVSKGFRGSKRKGSANVVEKARNMAIQAVPDARQVRKIEDFVNKKMRTL